RAPGPKSERAAYPGDARLDRSPRENGYDEKGPLPWSPIEREVDIRQEKSADREDGVGDAHIVDFLAQVLHEGATRAHEVLVETTAQDVVLERGDMPEKDRMDRVAQRPDGVEHDDLPERPPLQSSKLIDENPDEREVDIVEHDDTDNTDEEIGPVLHP